MTENTGTNNYDDFYTSNLMNSSVPYVVSATYNSLSTSAVLASRLMAWPLIVSRPTAFTAIGGNCTTAVAGSGIRLGLYNNGTNSKPSTLIGDYGVIDCSGTGELTLAISPAVTLQGFYWMIGVCSNHTPTLSSYSSNSSAGALMIGNSSISGANASALTRTSSSAYYSALPSDLSSDTFTLTTGVIGPAVFLKV